MPNPSPRARRRASPVSKGNSGAVAYDELRRRIVMLQLQPGADLDEANLGNELGISRTPLREALVRLASEGLVTVHPNRGARVASLELTQLQEHLEAFDLVQRAATKLAALRRTDEDLEIIEKHVEAFEQATRDEDTERMVESNWELHQAIGAACGNRVIQKFYSSQLTESLRVARLAMSYEAYGSVEAHDRHVSEILREHRELLDALERRDAQTAERLAGSHSNLARKRVTEYISLNRAQDIHVAVPGGQAG